MKPFPTHQELIQLITTLLLLSENNFLTITIDDEMCVTFACTPDDAIILPKRIGDFVGEIQVVEADNIEIKETFISYLYCYSPLPLKPDQTGDGSITLIEDPTAQC